MSDDNNYDGDEGGDAYDVFQEEEEPVQEEQLPLEADPADMEIVDEGDVGGAGLRDADDRITTKYMTKYERARILGTRALQIRYGAWCFGVVGWETLEVLLALGRYTRPLVFVALPPWPGGLASSLLVHDHHTHQLV